MHRRNRRFVPPPVKSGEGGGETLACLLRQFHPSYLRQLLAYLGQFVRATIHTHFQTSDGKAAEVPAEVSTAVLLVDALCKAAGVPRAAATRFIPAYIYDAINLPGAS